jgi:excisionase family DNA binding protein
MKSDLTLTVTEAAKRLGVGRNVAYNAAKSGQIPTIRIGNRILVPVAALDRHLADRPAVGHGRQKIEAETLNAHRETIAALERIKTNMRAFMTDLDRELRNATARCRRGEED